ncbi:polysaccharide lyase family 8 super-sandwich domain-containing protein [Chryseobacterium phocaeense]|uniref:polysaccharide lyase family 8 super-sandwich domain-containing protein n=1 Tax=Chryseobacterium phocaeense TaxID=1816690 RepID=UPI0009BBC45A|nr:polysaccharide lyase family 8 super-sandwich domain-containing protein [Chryseobacterium phocaeense]
MKNYTILLMFFIVSTFKSQISEINNIKAKYIQYYTDHNVPTSILTTPQASQIYTRYYSGCTNAITYLNTNINFSSPGPVWNLTNSTDDATFINLVRNQLYNMVVTYNLKGPLVNGAPSNQRYKDPALKNQILNLFQYFKNKGVSENSNFGHSEAIPVESFSATTAFGLRANLYGLCVLLMEDELRAAGEFAHHQGILNKLTYNLRPDNPNYNFTYTGFNLDVSRVWIETRLCYIFGLDESDPAKLTEMSHLLNFTNRATQIANGWSGGIKPDYTIFHHLTAYQNSYGADALNVFTRLYYFLAGSAYQLNSESVSNIKNAVMVYEKFCADNEIPRSLTGRFPNETLLNNQALLLLYSTDPAANNDAGQLYRNSFTSIDNSASLGVFTRLQMSLGNINLFSPSQGLLQGHFKFPFGGVSIHKYNGYHVSVKGTSKNVWNYEGGATENAFGRYNSAGTMEIFSQGSPKTRLNNGLGVASAAGTVTDDGWDWRHLPGVTAAALPLSSLNAAGNAQHLFSTQNFLAHASLDDKGVFALDYRDMNASTPMSALKSVFFYKDKIFCLGSDIKNLGGTVPIHTTLFQTGLPSANTQTIIDGNAQTGLSTNFTASQGGHWATDAAGNGFVVPAQGMNGILNIRRSTQQSRNHTNSADTNGNYKIAYIDHGTSPQAATYQYGIALNSTPLQTENFALNLSDYFQVLQLNSSAHVVKFSEDNSYNYVIFDAATNFNFNEVISTSRPSVIMSQKINNGNNLKISLTVPLNLLSDNEYLGFNQIWNNPSNFYRVSPAIQTTVTVAGLWQLANPTNNITTNIAGGNTVVTFTSNNGNTLQTNLVKIPTLHTDDSDYSIHSVLIYPNPATDYVRIKYPNNGSKISIFDMSGKDFTSAVKQHDHSNNNVFKEINLKNLLPGTYMICIEGNCSKLIKK